MKTTVSNSDFREAFRRAGRDGSWSYNGLNALYDYLRDMERDTGTDLELDVVALDCQFSEYSSAMDACQDFGVDVDVDEYADDDEREPEALKELEYVTTVIQFDGGVIVDTEF